MGILQRLRLPVSGLPTCEEVPRTLSRQGQSKFHEARLPQTTWTAILTSGVLAAFCSRARAISLSRMQHHYHRMIWIWTMTYQLRYQSWFGSTLRWRSIRLVGTGSKSTMPDQCQVLIVAIILFRRVCRNCGRIVLMSRLTSWLRQSLRRDSLFADLTAALKRHPAQAEFQDTVT